MKKALIILLVSLFAVLSFVSCNVDATDGLADQVSNSAPSSNTRILQYLGTNDAGAFVIRAENGIYTITDGVITSNKVSNDIKSACMLKHTPVSTTEVKECIFTLDNDGDLNYYTMDDPSTIHDSYDGTYSYLDDNGFLMQKIDDDNGCYIYMLYSNGTTTSLNTIDATNKYVELFTTKLSDTEYAILGRVSNGDTSTTTYTYKGYYVSAGTATESFSFTTTSLLTGFLGYSESEAYVIDAKKNVYYLTSTNNSLPDATYTLSNTQAADFNTYKYGDYIIFKTLSTFVYFQKGDDDITQLTTNWASELRACYLSGFDTTSDGELIVVTIGSGIWSVESVDATKAVQIFN